MVRTFSVAIALAAALAPAAAFATPVEVGTSRLTLAVGMRPLGEVSASTKGMSIAVGPSTCFSASSPSKSDILRVTNLVKSETERGSKVRLELRAQNAGSCTISFHSGKDSATTTVVVEPERP